MSTDLPPEYTTDQVSLSAGTGESALVVLARIRRAAECDGGYPMNLNPTDAGLLVQALYIVAHEHDGDPDFADQIADLYSSIATTLNIELI